MSVDVWRQKSDQTLAFARDLSSKKRAAKYSSWAGMNSSAMLGLMNVDHAYTRRGYSPPAFACGHQDITKDQSQVLRLLDALDHLQACHCSLHNHKEIEDFLLEWAVPADQLLRFVDKAGAESDCRLELQVIKDAETGMADLCFWLVGPFSVDRYIKANEILESCFHPELIARIAILVRSER